MKRGTPKHPKVFDLCDQLKCSRPTALGYLELLWHFTAEFAPQGDIGKYSDKRIEGALDWPRANGKLIAGLIASGWIDRNSGCRLAVHDWKDHADDSVRKKLARLGLEFLEDTEKLTGHRQNLFTTQDNSGGLPLPLPKPMPEPAVTTTADGVKFGELWERWPRKTGKDSACRDWLSVVTAENEPAVMACADRYLRSLEVSEGKVRNLGSTEAKTGWLIDCARDGWACDWPAVRQQDRRRGMMPIPEPPPAYSQADEIRAMRELLTSPLETEETKQVWRQKLTDLGVAL